MNDDSRTTELDVSKPAIPSVHVRACLTWLAIFPMAAIVLTFLSPLTVGWWPTFRALVLTLVVVPLAVYLVVPFFLRCHATLTARTSKRQP